MLFIDGLKRFNDNRITNKQKSMEREKYSQETIAFKMSGSVAMNGKAMEYRERRRQRQRSATISNSRRTMLALIVFAIALVCTGLNHRGPHYLCKLGVAAALTVAQRRAIVLSKIRRGMHLSQEAKHNVTAAEEACSVWENVLSRPSVSSSSESIITQDVLSLSKTLYASCLVRVGRDPEAVSVYDSCLNSLNNHEESTQWRLAKARCLQRLLKYADAAEEYEKVVADAKSGNDKRDATKGASTCILRSSGNVERARKILNEASDDNSLLLFCCLEYLETGKETPAMNQLHEVLSKTNVMSLDEDNSLNSTSNSSLIYRWILSTLKQHYRHRNHLESDTSTSSPSDGERASTTLDTKDLFMELIRINTSPLDDPGLLRLDDKIELHNLLTCTTNSKDPKETVGTFSSLDYWPESLVLPNDSAEFDDKTGNDSQLWISKSSAGYGSHGNQILTLGDARKQLKEDSTESEPYLLQRMVEPLMLLEGYKFSLRIYVVFFSSEEAYISSKGLVKLASMPLRSSDERNSILDTKMHMTNSGRETVMRQEDLEYLWKECNNNAEKEELWKDICKVASDTLLVRYHQEIIGANDIPQKLEWKARREQWGIPKILGLDFVVQEGVDRKKPWLVEVNRFPGLEPRDEDDRKIKYKIVRDAWKMASERLCMGEDSFDLSIFDSLCSDVDQESSLERLQVNDINFGIALHL